jgi:hypothetical protein
MCLVPGSGTEAHALRHINTTQHLNSPTATTTIRTPMRTSALLCVVALLAIGATCGAQEAEQPAYGVFKVMVAQSASGGGGCVCVGGGGLATPAITAGLIWHGAQSPPAYSEADEVRVCCPLFCCSPAPDDA